MTDKRDQLEATAKQMVAEGRGILAADESTPTMGKRLASVGVDDSEDNRLAFRELIFKTEPAHEQISGVILYDETLRQNTSDGTPVPDYLSSHGMLPGIKVDTGAKPLANAEGEKVTEGLDGLRERLEEYYELGARFAKWRAVITIDTDEDMPSPYCISVNAHALARYAALCQEAGIMPIVEPEVLMDGDHSIDVSERVSGDTLRAVFAELESQRVTLEGIVLKPNMVLSGYDAPEQASVEEVAERTLKLFREVVPASVPGIAFLSGGQSDERAAAHLNAINNSGEQPWELTFSYGRALLGTPLKTWSGEDSNLEAAQEAFAHRARCNAEARAGRYTEDMERAAA
ncbi:MAG: fructose-bisphosphate aldolase class I [Actinomycetota bacterium]|nr:fructose-bisphosphate aldolase class I [Actinomycetota bacterium]